MKLKDKAAFAFHVLSWRFILRRVNTHALVLSVVLIGVVVAGAAWMLLDVRQAYTRLAVHSVESASSGLERDVRQAIETLDMSLRAVAAAAQRPDLANLAPGLRQALLFEGASAAQPFHSIMVTDEAGWAAQDSSSAVPRRINVADLDYFQALRLDRPAGLRIGLPSPDRGDGLRSISLARRITRSDGSFAGVAVGALPLSHFMSLSANLDLGEGGSAALLMTTGEMLIQQPFDEHDIGNDAAAAVFQHLARASSGTFEAAAFLDSVPRLYAYRQVGSFPLVVTVGRSKGAIYADWSRMALVTSAAMALTLTLASLLAFGLWRELRRRSGAECLARYAETAAQESATYLRLVTTGAGDLLLTVNWDGMPRYVSPSSLQMLGRPSDQVLRVHWLESVHADDRANLAAALSAMQSGFAAPGPLRSRVQHADGSWRWLESVGGSLPDGSSAVFIIRDVTGRKQVEEDLNQLNEDLEARVGEAVAAREAALVRTTHAERMEVLVQLAGGVAHDFNNVLQAVSGCTALIEQRPYDIAGVRRLTGGVSPNPRKFRRDFEPCLCDFG